MRATDCEIKRRIGSSGKEKGKARRRKRNWQLINASLHFEKEQLYSASSGR